MVPHSPSAWLHNCSLARDDSLSAIVLKFCLSFAVTFGSSSLPNADFLRGFRPPSGLHPLLLEISGDRPRVPGVGPSKSLSPPGRSAFAETAVFQSAVIGGVLRGVRLTPFP